MCEYPKTVIKIKIWQSLKFWEFSLFGREGFLFKLVAAKVICQHMFFFTLSYYLDKKFWNKKKAVTVLVHESHDKWSNVKPVQNVCSGLNMQILLVLSVASNINQKLDSEMCIFSSEYEHLKRFVRKYDNIFPYKRKIRYRAHYINGGIKCLL